MTTFRLRLARVRPAALAAGAGACLLLLAVTAVTASAQEDGDASARLRAAIASPERPEAERARDAHRHPLETLRFFGIEPDMHVLELWPGGGWYTQILAPYLREKGQLTVTSYDPAGPEDEYPTRSARRYAELLEAERDRFGEVGVVIVDPPEKLDLGPDATYDAVLTFRNNHGWLRGGYHDALYEEAFRVLRPGGVLGVVQHRAEAGADPETAAERGYVPEATVVSAAQRAGFALEARSEVNANPRDTKDYPEGVWTLPPSYRLEDEDRARYEAIGESDRMTLLFRKPASGGGAAEGAEDAQGEDEPTG